MHTCGAYNGVAWGTRNSNFHHNDPLPADLYANIERSEPLRINFDLSVVRLMDNSDLVTLMNLNVKLKNVVFWWISTISISTSIMKIRRVSISFAFEFNNIHISMFEQRLSFAMNKSTVCFELTEEKFSPFTYEFQFIN